METSTPPSPRRAAAKSSRPAARTAPKASPAVAGKKSAAASRKAAKPAPAAKPSKPKKPKLVRDSFTIPKDEYEALAALKQRCLALAHPSKKSELLRAGIKALAAMSDKHLLAAVQAVPSIKTGRPKQA